MIFLGIDTSCDDTSVGIVDGTRILANVISSQDDIHRSWGGVVPNLAKRAHEEHFAQVLATALQRAKVSWSHIDAIAVTRGPGLAIALGVGIEKARELAATHKLPLYAVNHMEGHLLSVFAQPKTATEAPQYAFPALGVLASGKHTELVDVQALGQYHVIGATLDDAFGEAFDKTARLLGLGYPGGGVLARLADQGNPQAFALPRAMRGTKDLNMSYSGLKTAVVKLVKQLESEHGPLSPQLTMDVAASFQAAAVETLTHKVAKALASSEYTALMLGGGAANNLALRRELRQLAQQHHIPFLAPYSRKLCQDNGAMIALAASLAYERGVQPNDPATIDRLARWQIGQ